MAPEPRGMAPGLGAHYNLPHGIPRRSDRPGAARPGRSYARATARHLSVPAAHPLLGGAARRPVPAEQGHRGLFRSLGQEGESVASAYALDRGPNRDILSPLIRNLGSMLVMGAQPIQILRQYMAKAESPTRGRELNVHFNDLERGYLGQISHLGDMVPVMAGHAL